jgi:hypothetical protein
MMRYFLGLLLIVLFNAVLDSGCTGNRFKQEIKTCDSLLTVLDKTAKLFATIDSAMYSAVREDVNTTIQGIENYYKTLNDTMPNKEAFLLGDYKLVFKGYKRFNQHYGQHNAELKYSIKQISDLKTDLKNNAITKPIAKRFLAEELNNTSQLEISVSGFELQVTKTYEKYLEQKPVMVQLLDSLNNIMPPLK